MGFSLATLKKPEPIKDSIVKSFDTIFNDDSKLEIVLEVKQDPEFTSAFAKVNSELSSQKLSTSSLKRGNQSEITSYEGVLFVIGEYCVKSWNVDVNGEPVMPDGDTFLAVCNEIAKDDTVFLDFINKLLPVFTGMMNEFKELVENVKKKPSKAITGKGEQAN